MPSFVIEKDAVSAAPVEDLWPLLADGGRWPEWNPTVRWAVVEGPLEAGSFLTIQPARGRQTAYTIESVEAPSRLTFAIRFGPLGRVGYEYRILPEGAGSRIRVRAEVSGAIRGLLVRAAGKRLAAAVPALAAGLAGAAGKR